MPAASEETVQIVMNALSPHRAMDRIRIMLEASFEHTFGYLMFQWDPHTYDREQRSRIWLRELFAPYVSDAGIPIWSTSRVLTFMKQRRKYTCDTLEWNGRSLRASLTVPLCESGSLTLMLPTDGKFGPLLEVRINRREQHEWPVIHLQGRNFALVNVPSGKVRLDATFQPPKK
jgi:hypothetical protein